MPNCHQTAFRRRRLRHCRIKHITQRRPNDSLPNDNQSSHGLCRHPTITTQTPSQSVQVEHQRTIGDDDASVSRCSTYSVALRISSRSATCISIRPCFDCTTRLPLWCWCLFRWSSPHANTLAIPLTVCTPKTFQRTSSTHTAGSIRRMPWRVCFWRRSARRCRIRVLGIRRGSTTIERCTSTTSGCVSACFFRYVVWDYIYIYIGEVGDMQLNMEIVVYSGKFWSQQKKYQCSHVRIKKQ